jgi:hypothetical protein
MRSTSRSPRRSIACAAVACTASARATTRTPTPLRADRRAPHVPCFDEPSYKVPWQLTFHVKAEHVALANAPVVRETPEGGGMKKVEIAESKPLPSYLVAFVVGPFELVDGGTTGRVNTPIRFIIPRGRAGELGYARQITPKVVAALEDYFDMAYPYVKLDVAVVPRFWGTMEHPGIVAMGQPLTLIRTDQATRERKRGHRGPKDSEELHDLRKQLVPLVAREDRALSAEATRLADQWLANRTGITDDLVGDVLRVAALRGDASRFDRYLAAARTARDRNEKRRLLGSLGDFPDPAIAERGLAIVLGTEFDLRETLGILLGVLGERETRDLGVAFVSAHLDEMLARMRDDDAAGLLRRLAGRFCDPARKSAMAALVVPRAAKIGGAENAVTRALEQADQCIAHVQRQLPGLRRVLRAN